LRERARRPAAGVVRPGRPGYGGRRLWSTVTREMRRAADKARSPGETLGQEHAPQAQAERQDGMIPDADSKEHLHGAERKRGRAAKRPKCMAREAVRMVTPAVSSRTLM